MKCRSTKINKLWNCIHELVWKSWSSAIWGSEKDNDWLGRSTMSWNLIGMTKSIGGKNTSLNWSTLWVVTKFEFLLQSFSFSMTNLWLIWVLPLTSMIKDSIFSTFSTIKMPLCNSSLFPFLRKSRASGVIFAYQINNLTHKMSSHNPTQYFCDSFKFNKYYKTNPHVFIKRIVCTDVSSFRGVRSQSVGFRMMESHCYQVGISSDIIYSPLKLGQSHYSNIYVWMCVYNIPIRKRCSPLWARPAQF